MKTIALRPPLPVSLSHDGIQFVLDESIASTATGGISGRVLAAIASSLQTILPPEGDLFVDANGSISGTLKSNQPTQTLSLWYQVGLLEGVERSMR
jgi:hypothetical protein